MGRPGRKVVGQFVHALRLSFCDLFDWIRLTSIYGAIEIGEVCMTLITTHVFPEFLIEEPLVDGASYVIADLGPDHRLDIFKEHPTYRAESDSWAFNDRSRKRTDEDFWLPERRYIQLVAAKGLRQELEFDF